MEFCKGGEQSIVLRLYSVSILRYMYIYIYLGRQPVVLIEQRRNP